MAFKKLRVQAKPKEDKRGTLDAVGMIELCENNWDEVQN